jgi:hypothetical protein
MRPIAHSDRHDLPGLGDQLVPSIAAMGEMLSRYLRKLAMTGRRSIHASFPIAAFHSAMA